MGSDQKMPTVSAESAEHLSAEEVFERLPCPPGGLSSQEAAQRLRQVGPNELADEKVNPILEFLSYF